MIVLGFSFFEAVFHSVSMDDSEVHLPQTLRDWPASASVRNYQCHPVLFFFLRHDLTMCVA